jgi:hypothetical protein
MPFSLIQCSLTIQLIRLTKALFGTNPTDDGAKTISQNFRNYSGSIVVYDAVSDTRSDVSSNTNQAGTRVEYDQRSLVAVNYVCDQWIPSSSSWTYMYAAKAFTHDWAGRVLTETVFADNGSGNRGNRGTVYRFVLDLFLFCCQNHVMVRLARVVAVG